MAGYFSMSILGSPLSEMPLCEAIKYNPAQLYPYRLMSLPRKIGHFSYSILPRRV